MSTILLSIKVAVFLSILGISTMEILMNKKKTAVFGLTLASLSFLMTSILELFLSVQGNVISSALGYNILIMNSIFFILGGIGLIFYFVGLKSHKK
jgi:hypothetical protein